MVQELGELKLCAFFKNVTNETGGEVVQDHKAFRWNIFTQNQSNPLVTYHHYHLQSPKRLPDI
jgi:hypothetical protein